MTDQQVVLLRQKLMEGGTSGWQIPALSGWSGAMVSRQCRKRGNRAIRGGRGTVRSALYLCAWSVIRHDAEMRRFYDRLRERGKPGNVSVLALMRKLLTILNGMVKSGQHWDPSIAAP